MLSVVILLSFVSALFAASPNIVFLLFDDLGWTDISYNGGQIETPNIDSLFSESINLKKHYIHLICSNSRSQFLTGRYAMYSGYGKLSPFGIGHIGGIPQGIPSFAQWLKAYNSEYSTYGVGKWVLGYSTDSLLPHSKGFDEFMGAYTAGIDYSNGMVTANKCDGCNPNRYDITDNGNDYIVKTSNIMYDFRQRMYQNLDTEIEKNQNNNYQSPFYMFFPLPSPHGPLNAMSAYRDRCSSMIGPMIGNEKELIHRAKYCQVMLASDDIIGDVISRLKSDAKIWDNTLFVLTSDNGGDIENTGCNYPLRGTKGTLFEGNQRVIALIGGGIIPKEQYGTSRESLFSALDWTPTLLQFVGIYDQIDEVDRTWDGINQYDLIMSGDDYKRDHIVFTVEERNLDTGTIIFMYDGSLYKYIADKNSRPSKRLDGWCEPDEINGDWNVFVNDIESNTDLAPETQAFDGTYLFNLDDDLGERNNIFINNPNKKYPVPAIMNYAKSILTKYTEHPLYCDPVGGLWNYDVNEDDGTDYLHPWLTQQEYHDVINAMFDENIRKHHNTISNELRSLYNNPWVPPNQKSSIYQLFGSIANMSITDNISMLAIMTGMVAMFAIIAIIYYYKTKNQFKYIPIDQ